MATINNQYNSYTSSSSFSDDAMEAPHVSAQAAAATEAEVNGGSAFGGVTAPSEASATGDPTWDPSSLSSTWADTEAAGLISFLDMGEKSYSDASAPAVRWAWDKLKQISAKSSLSPGMSAVVTKVLTIMSSSDPAGGLKAYWVATNPDGTDGAVKTVWELIGSYTKSPGALTLPGDDDGTAQFLGSCLFADFGTLGAAKISDAADDFFSYTVPGSFMAPGSYYYALQSANYLTKQIDPATGQKFPAADLPAIGDILCIAPASPEASVSDYQTNLKAAMTAASTWSSTYQALVEGEADSLWNDYANQSSE